jgi:hypothetical protein
MRIAVLVIVILLIIFNIYLLALSPLISVPSPRTPLRVVGPLVPIINELLASVPEEASGAMKKVEESVALCTLILSGIDTDRFACVIPVNTTASTAKLIVPEGGAFAPTTRTGSTLGDAIIEHKRQLYLTNPLQELIAMHVEVIKTQLASILLDLSRTPHSSVRTRRSIEIVLNAAESFSTDIVRSCAKQRLRLKDIYPVLSHYTFSNEVPHSLTHLPRYDFGSESAEPVRRVYPAPSMATAMAEISASTQGALLDTTDRPRKVLPRHRVVDKQSVSSII